MVRGNGPVYEEPLVLDVESGTGGCDVLGLVCVCACACVRVCVCVIERVLDHFSEHLVMLMVVVCF